MGSEDLVAQLGTGLEAGDERDELLLDDFDGGDWLVSTPADYLRTGWFAAWPRS